ncbi:MAG: site-specific integrase [Terracidiphilus sp.]
MASGERYSVLVDADSGLPLLYPNLFVTSQVRNGSDSKASMDTALNAIQVLLVFCETNGIDLISRFRGRRFFTVQEIDAIRDACQKRFSRRQSPRVVPIDGKRTSSKTPNKLVGAHSEYARITYIAKYLKWLADTLLAGSIDSDTNRLLEKMVVQLNARRPRKKGRNRLAQVKGLDDRQTEILAELIRPDSKNNPFKEIGVRYRNFAIFLLLRYLGIRIGELLNIKTSDIKTGSNRIVIARRADERADPRLHQPLVKTMDHLDPMRETLALVIHTYIKQHRNRVKNARSHEYLFVTHKAGKTVGQALSISSFHKMIKVIARSVLDLHGLHGHALRHRWNYEFSKILDALENPPSPVEQEQIREYLQGWKPGSGTAAAYNQRFIEAKSLKVALELQKGMTRIPESLKNETTGNRPR